MGRRTTVSIADAQKMQDRLARHTKQENPISEAWRKLHPLTDDHCDRLDAKMNKTEFTYSHILEARRSKGEILDWQFEPITLRIGDNCKYTPDFCISERNGSVSIEDIKFLASRTMLEFVESERARELLWQLRTTETGITFIEIKGAHIWDDAKVKFKAAKDKYLWAKFQMWQLKRGEWKQIA